MEFAPFGSTEHRSSRIIFGAAALGGMSQDRADVTLDLISSAGINHIDTAASYGQSELRLAPWLKQHRKRVFLATKTGERNGGDARAELERSLERLGVDQVDLVQLHNLVEPDEWEQAHGPGGAVEALAKARDEGLVKYLGITGHGLRIATMHARSLERFPFDSVLFPWSYVLSEVADYRTNVDHLISMCTYRRVAIQTIKAIARRRWAPDNDAKRFSWYEPIREPEVIERSVHWVLNDDRVFLNTTSDATLLPHVLAAADRQRNDQDGLTTQLAAGTLGLGILPLFDGAALERI